MTDTTQTYTVRPLGCTAWEDGITSLEAAQQSRREAVDAGLYRVVIVDDLTGEIVVQDY